jgi:hypothetical protein
VSGRVTRVAACLVALALTTGLAARQQSSKPALQPILHAAGLYVQQYARAMADVVLLEDYLQMVKGNGQDRARRTQADMILVDAGAAGWVAFRDVFEVDGHPVRDRTDRLMRLLTESSSGSLEQARLMSAESARFNLDTVDISIDRTVNSPVTALLFLRPANQSHSSFRLGDASDVDGAPCRMVEFTERGKPSIIRSTPGSSAYGSFCVDPPSGRVLRSALHVEAPVQGDFTRFVRASITVTFAHVPKLGLWAPQAMDELYELPSSRESINGHADYSNFRQFGVTTSERPR